MKEEKTCKNCLYYVGDYFITSKWFPDIGGVCVNYNPYYPERCIPGDKVKDCMFWESKEQGADNIPF